MPHAELAVPEDETFQYYRIKFGEETKITKKGTFEKTRKLMEKLDLNIHNYDLNDLINLFRLPFHFKEEHLKEAKKIVLKTHPDKSGLDKEYFLFFSQAYKYLLKIHQLRQSSTTTNCTSLRWCVYC